MRRFAVLIVAVVAVFATGVSIGQENAPVPMPEMVQKFLGNFIGTWDIAGGPITGTATYAWDSEKNYVIGTGQDKMGDVPFTDTSLWRWDGVSRDGIIVYSTSSRGHSIDRLKVVSETVVEGRGTGVQDGKKGRGTMRVEHKGSDQFTMTFTNGMVGDEKQPDWTGVFSRANSTSDEQALIRLNNVWLDAMLKGDAAPLDRILADDYTLGGYDGTVFTKPQYLALMKSGDYVVASIKNDGTKVRIYGETAVTTTLWTEKSQDKGTNMSGQYRSTETWLKRDGQWQCIATHESRIAKTTNDDQKAVTAQPSPELKKLEGLVGAWTYEGEQAKSPVAGLPYGGAGKYFGTSTSHFVLDGTFLEEKIEDNNPSGRTSIVTLTGYDAKAEKYTESTFISDGSSSDSTFTLNRRTLTSDSTMTTGEGKKVLSRSVAKYSSDWSSYVSTTEASPDHGKTWKQKVVYELTQLDKKLWKALMGCDIDTLDRLYAEEFIGLYNIDRNGSMWTKDAALATVKSGKSVIYSYTYDEFNVHVTGDWAAITGTVSVKEKFDGKDLDDKHRFTSMWAKKSTGWKCVSENYAVISDPAERNKAIYRRIFEEVINNPNWDSYEDIYHKDFVFHGPNGRDVKGIKQFWNDIKSVGSIFPDYREVEVETIAQGDFVASHWISTGTHKKNGKKFKISNMTMHRFEDGKVSEVWFFCDRDTQKKQLGLDNIFDEE